ncbi:MAG: putative DNA binding domain-containing protein [Armatimonadetes bacterium]|nr:putative DNA binding domain-containing protein [Armatimonadota bacterium]
MNIADVNALLLADENERCEFKEAKTSFNRERLVEYCLALANELGGKLILGVTDRKPRRVVGSTAFQNLEDVKHFLLTTLRLRVEVEEILHSEGRVLVFSIPSRPIGTPLHIDGRYLMRSGESLVPMTSDQMKRILDEAEPEFSATICAKSTLNDLDPAAIELFRARWIRKSGNEKLLSLTPEQVLMDAELVVDGQITYAALALLGTRQALGKHLAQAEVVFEYRSNGASGPAAQREEFRQGFLLTLDSVWNLINLRNDKQHFQDGLYIWDIPTFNEDAVREAILNAVCHRDYRNGGSVFVRQYPRRLEVISPGGFPAGITIENILWRQSPRNRRIAEAVARCGLVERAGQGMNRIYEACIRESKPAPDFSQTDAYQIGMTLHGEIQDARFLRFLEKIGSEQLSHFTTHEFLVLDLVHREQRLPDYLRGSVPPLVERGVVEPAGRGKYMLSRSLYAFLGQKGVYTRKRGLDRATEKELLFKHIKDNDKVGSKLDELMQVLPARTTRQVRYLLQELKDEGRIHPVGRTQASRWRCGAEPDGKDGN